MEGKSFRPKLHCRHQSRAVLKGLKKRADNQLDHLHVVLVRAADLIGHLLEAFFDFFAGHFDFFAVFLVDRGRIDIDCHIAFQQSFGKRLVKGGVQARAFKGELPGHFLIRCDRRIVLHIDKINRLILHGDFFKAGRVGLER